MVKEPIKAIVGLGNPGPQFMHTRHNIGFMVLDAYAQAQRLDWSTKDAFAYATVQHGDRSILLIKPQTFMNSSGKVIPWLRKKGIEASEVLVIHDELELPFGKIKTKFGGSAKGHNGLRSIIEQAGTDQFHRLAIGIGRPTDGQPVADYVLAPFDRKALVDSALVEQAIMALEKLL